MKKQHLNPTVFDNAAISWTAPEYTHHEKSILWYICAGAVAAVLVFYGLMTDGWTFSIAIVAFAGTYYVLQMHRPAQVAIKISSVGVKVGHHIFPFNGMKGFWIVYDPPYVSKLYVRMKSRLHPDIFVELSDTDPGELATHLKQHVKQLARGSEPFSDSILRLLKL